MWHLLSRVMIYQHPLAYLLGLEGIALLRAFGGAHDRAFTEARLAEIRALLDDDGLGEGGFAMPGTTQDGYRAWAPSYDGQANQLIDIEQPIVRRIIDTMPRGSALDAACGTGRHAEYLTELGHDVVGLDSSPEMLAIARTKLPSLPFVEGDLERLPFPNDSMDLVVCALALAHVPDLRAVIAEFARVLRPNGSLITSDSRGILGDLGIPVAQRLPDGTPSYVPHHQRLTSDYLAAALPLGLEVRRCEEPRRPRPFVNTRGVPPGRGPAPAHVQNERPNIWALHPWCPDAVNAAYDDSPAALIWHFQLAPLTDPPVGSRKTTGMTRSVLDS